MKDLTELKAKAMAATEGEWLVFDSYHENHVDIQDKAGHRIAVCCSCFPTPSPPKMEKNADFIASFSPKTALELCEEIEKIRDAMEQQIIEYESRGQYMYAGLGAPSSIRLVYDLLGIKKPKDLSALENGGE